MNDFDHMLDMMPPLRDSNANQEEMVEPIAYDSNEDEDEFEDAEEGPHQQ